MARVINKGSGWTQAFERIMPVLRTGGQNGPAAAGADGEGPGSRLPDRGMEAGAPMLIAHTVRSTVEAAANELGADANIDEMSRLFEARAGVRLRRAATKNCKARSARHSS